MSTGGSLDEVRVVSRAIRTRSFDSNFHTTMVRGLQQTGLTELVLALTSGPFVIRGALDPGVAATYAAGFEKLRSSHQVDSYAQEVIGHAALHLGPALFDTYDDPAGLAEGYTRQERHARAILRAEFGHDPGRALKDILRSFGLHVRAARSALPGVPFASAGLIRDLREGSLLHWDNILREAPGLLRDVPILIGTVNVFCSVPRGGGEVVVHDQEWRSADEDFRDKYGYENSVAAKAARVRVAPTVGDAVIFRAAQMHQVVPSTEGSRWTISCFFGLTINRALDPEIVVWG